MAPINCHHNSTCCPMYKSFVVALLYKLYRCIYGIVKPVIRILDIPQIMSPSSECKAFSFALQFPDAVLECLIIFLSFLCCDLGRHQTLIPFLKTCISYIYTCFQFQHHYPSTTPHPRHTHTGPHISCTSHCIKCTGPMSCRPPLLLYAHHP